MPFSTDFVFSRGTGKTRTNAAGLIVGVDFSSTSNTITTGSKTFTLAADLNVNRAWTTGESVIAVAQGGEGTMTGTVTTYTPSTQSLVINVTSVTGTGTSTNWRIGSLAMTRDALTGGVSSEPAATNLLTFSEQFENAVWTKANTTVSSNVTLSPDGSTNADKLVENTANSQHFTQQVFTAVAGQTYSTQYQVKAGERGFAIVAFSGGGLSPDCSVGINLQTGAIVSTANSPDFVSVKASANGFFNVVLSKTMPSSAATASRILLSDNGTNQVYTGDGTSGIFIWGAQLELNAPTSYIPTTTAQVTRAADSFALSSTALSAIRQGQGTLYVEAESADVGPTQKRAIRLSGLTGDIRLAKRGVGNFAGFTKMLEVDNDLYFGTTAGQSQRDNGKEIGSFSAVNERTGVSTTVINFSALAWDGATDILYAGGNTAEVLLKKDLSVFSTRGFSGDQINGGTHTGTRFIFSSGLAGSVFLSTDGLTYRRVNTPVITQATNEVTSGLVAGQTRVVIVGNAGFIATSDDQGETWTSRASGTVQSIAGATFGANLFVVCVQDTANNIRTSPDGITWTARTTVSAQIQYDVAYNGTNLFVSVGDNGTIQTSPDGITWTARTSGTTQSLRGVHFANGLWVICGLGGTILTSPDGITWTTQTSGTTEVLREVNYFNNTWVVAGNIIITSPNAVNWTPRSGNILGALQGIAASPTRVVITGTNGAVTTSEDALTYTSRTNNAAGINGMAFGNGVFVSVGNNTGGDGYVATIDGAGNYTRRAINRIVNLTNVRFVNGQFFITGLGSQISTSTNGATYTNRSTPALDPYDIAFNGLVYVVVGDGGGQGRFTVSTDGVTFPTATSFSGSGTSLRGVWFANNLFVTVGSGGVIATSPNGTTWALRTSGTTQNLNSVMYSTRDQLWYAAGAAGTLLFSADATTWQSVQNAGFASIDNSGLQVNPMLPLWVNGRNRIAVSYATNNVIASQNGVSRADLTATIPTITAGAMGENLNGLIHKMRFFPTTLTEAEINAMTGI